MEKREIKSIGIVLSGGFARGIAQLAFVSELVKKIRDKVVVLSGSSIGAINAYALSCGTENHLLKYYATSEMGSLFTFMKMLRSGLYDDIYTSIKKRKMTIPTYVSVTRLFPIDLYYFNLNNVQVNDIKKLINLSMSFPGLNGPKFFKGNLYLDGGATNNVPIYPTNYFDLDMVIVIHCYPKYYPPISELRDNRILIDVDCTLTLEQNVTPFSFDRYSVEKMIDEGKKAGKKFTEEIFKDFDYDNVRNRCFNYTHKNLELRYKKSGGVLALVEYSNAIFSFKNL